MNSIERHAYGPGTFIVEARATRALLKFCIDHNDTSPTLAELRSCLAALEAGEKSNAVKAFKRVPMGREGFGDWFPPAVAPSEDAAYTLGVFEALVERWYRLMKGLGSSR